MRKLIKLPPLRVYDYSPDVSLRIRQLGNEYQAEIRAGDDYFDQFPIPMTPLQVGALNTRLRNVLQQVVDGADELDLPKNKSAQFFKELASAGALAYKEVFRNRLNETARLFSSLSSHQPASIQIVSEDFSIPWELLYIGNSASVTKVDDFLGTSWLISRIAVYPVRANSEMKCDEARLFVQRLAHA